MTKRFYSLGAYFGCNKIQVLEAGHGAQVSQSRITYVCMIQLETGDIFEFRDNQQSRIGDLCAPHL